MSANLQYALNLDTNNSRQFLVSYLQYDKINKLKSADLEFLTLVQRPHKSFCTATPVLVEYWEDRKIGGALRIETISIHIVSVSIFTTIRMMNNIWKFTSHSVKYAPSLSVENDAGHFMNECVDFKKDTIISTYNTSKFHLVNQHE